MTLYDLCGALAVLYIWYRADRADHRPVSVADDWFGVLIVFLGFAVGSIPIAMLGSEDATLWLHLFRVMCLWFGIDGSIKLFRRRRMSGKTN
jgi:hypothetical protein